MDKNFKISLILPVYKVEQFLQKCLDSLVNQTYQNIEIISIVDASPDNSLSIIQKYAERDNRIKFQNLQHNLGVSKARNIGIDLATGDYIMFVDSDDYVDTDMLERYLSEMDKAYDLIVTGLKIVHPDDKPDELVVPKPFETKQINELGEIYPALDELGVLMAPYNKLFKRSVLADNNIKFPNISLGEDQCFVLDYLLHSTTIKVCSFASYYYVKHLSPTLSKGNQRSFDAMYEFLDLKFKLKNELLAKMHLPLETDEVFFKKNHIFYSSAIIALYSPKFLAPVKKRKKELRKFRKSNLFELYKAQDFGKRQNLIKIPVCYLPISLADIIMKKIIQWHFSA
jgi:glycosyltransferase involved in cell wall biosynthesis